MVWFRSHHVIVSFKVGNTANPASWQAAPAPTVASVREMDGAGGSKFDWVALVRDDGLIKNTWLQVTVWRTR